MRWHVVIAISALVLAPVFWLPLVSAGDLQSHLYNAWLARLVAEGRAPGLHVVTMATNALVDQILVVALSIANAGIAERVAAATAALSFFWGSYLLIAGLIDSPPWSVIPWLLAETFGFAFQAGLVNFVTSAGLSCAAVALLCRRSFVRTVLLLGAAWFAHPVPVLWAAGFAAVLCTPPRARRAIVLAAAVLVVAARVALDCWMETRWSTGQLWLVTGADQFLLFGPMYRVCWGAFLGMASFALASRKVRTSARTSAALPMLAVTAAAIAILPNEFRVAAGHAWAGLLPQRLSLLSLVLLLAVVTPARRLVLGTGMAAAAVFFALLHSDLTRAAATLAELRRAVAQLPDGARVLGYLPPSPNSRIRTTHLLARACLGHCFDYANYEPASRQFRVRAEPRNSFVVASIDDAYAMEWGDYTRREADPDLVAVVPCGAGYCARPLAVGDSPHAMATRR